MKIEIRRLRPKLLDDYLHFFENVAHTDNKEWDRCYCTNYCAAHNNRIAKRKNYFDPNIRKQYAIDYVNNNLLQGYLAYADGKVIGWCNANSRKDCLHCFGWKNLIENKQINKKSKEKIKSVFCFTVAPEMRGKGIASALLEKVIEDARADGYDYIEAYPNKEKTDMYYNYVGPLNLYKKFGFEMCAETKWRLVLRKSLKSCS